MTYSRLHSRKMGMLLSTESRKPLALPGVSFRTVKTHSLMIPAALPLVAFILRHVLYILLSSTRKCESTRIELRSRDFLHFSSVLYYGSCQQQP